MEGIEGENGVDDFVKALLGCCSGLNCCKRGHSTSLVIDFVFGKGFKLNVLFCFLRKLYWYSVPFRCINFKLRKLERMFKLRRRLLHVRARLVVVVP